jgi:acetylornithine deacetylase/succinyl-diaminopimelate desuccinylase-like protein
VPGFVIPADHPLVLKAQPILQTTLGQPVGVHCWEFCTDGAYLVRAGIPTIGFAPAAEQYLHTVDDRIALKAMLEGLMGYMALALELGRA